MPVLAEIIFKRVFQNPQSRNSQPFLILHFLLSVKHPYMYTIKTANVTVMTKDMDKSIDFYTKGLGLELKQRWDNHYAQVSAPGVVIGLHPARETGNASADISIGFGVDSLAEAEKRLKELNVSYETTEDKTGKIAYFKDPDGTTLYFME